MRHLARSIVTAAALVLGSCGWLLDLGDPEATTTTPDAPVACAAPATACGSSCVELEFNVNHCGRCDHACGGAACLDGRCQPASLAIGLDGPHEVEVTNDEIYVAHRTGVAACPLAGCSGAPRPVAFGLERVGEIEIAGDTLYLIAAPADQAEDTHRLLRCPITGCPTVIPAVNAAAPFSDLWIGATRAYWRNEGLAVGSCLLASCPTTLASWNEPDFGTDVTQLALDDDTVYVGVAGDLRTCPAADGCAAPGTLPDTRSIGLPFRVHGDRAYWIGGASGLVFILTCPVGDCAMPVVFASDAAGVKWVEVDDTGVYWLNDVTGTLRHCPLAGCPTDPDETYLVKGRDVPEHLALGPGFAYWIERSGVYRVAKP